jgi:tetratricopeptide (TPR) repeat protein
MTAALIVWSSGPSAQPPGQIVSPQELFKRGNELYEAGDFEEAAASYEEAVSRGANVSDLYYNLGNAYYKAGLLGRAVLNYERALRLAPRNDDARANLGLVRSLLRDKQFVEEPGVFKRIITWLNRNLNLRETILVSSLVYFILSIVVILFIFRETKAVSRFYSAVSMLSPGRFLGLEKSQDFLLATAVLTLILIASGVSAFGKYDAVRSKRAAVVVELEAPVYSGPSEESTLQFKIHEGTKVVTDETRPGWVQIELPGDLSGWIDNRLIERI